MKQAHFVMVHGLCHGGWCWYKVKPRLEAAGHHVTVLNMAAAGINTKDIKDVHTFEEYAEPLIEFMGSVSDKVILVGHSFGGMSLALAMEKFPDRVSASVFLTAFLPDTKNQPSYVIDKFLEISPLEMWMDTKVESCGAEMLIFLGDKFMESNLYQLSPVEDLELAKTVLRRGTFFLSDLSKAKKFSDEAYGSVKRVYIICGEDKTVTEEYQRWSIRNYSVDEVVEIKSSDHMPMFSRPDELCDALIKIADKYT